MRTEIRRPMLIIAAFSAASALLCACGFGWPLIIAIAAVAAIVMAILLRRSTLPIVIALVCACVVALGFARQSDLARELEEKYDGQEIVLEGKVYHPPVFYESRETYVLDTELGLVELTLFRPGMDRASIGDTVRIKANLSAPLPPENDYAFDYRTYQYSRRIYLTAAGAGEMEIEKSSKITPRIIAGRIREAAVAAGERLLRGDALGLYCAVVFGDRRHMGASLKSTLTAAGLNHIAAVSGMHLSVVTMVVMFLVSLLFGRRRLGTLAAMLAVIAFTIVTGAGTSVVRACIMSLIYLSSRLIYREADPLSSLSAAVTLMLLFNPMIIYSSGFQLSVMATLGILLFMPLWTERLKIMPKIPRGVLEIVLVSVSAQLGVFPILIHSFNSFPVYFLLANLAVVPVLTLAMPLGLLLPLAEKVPYLDLIWGRLCSTVFGYIGFAAGKIKSLPGAVVPVGSLNLLLIIAYIFAAVALWLLLKKYHRSCAVLAAVTMVLTAAGGVMLHAENNRAVLSFLNVGRGDCALFRLPKGRTVLIDCGSDSYDVMDFLSGCGKNRVDVCVITSTDREHCGGLSNLIEAGMVDRLWLPEEIAKTDEGRYYLFIAESMGVDVELCGDDDQLYIDGFKLSRFAYNDGAALAAEYNGRKIFFAADGYTAWPADCSIVKTPNHGSGKYNYYNELKSASPRYTVVSGRRKALDGGAYLKSIEELGLEYFLTQERGTVSFDLGGDKISVRTTN